MLSRQSTDLPVDRTRWNALVAESPSATVFQTYEWFECWWAYFGHHRQLFLVTVWDGESLLGIAPLMKFRRTGLRHLEFVGSPNADYQDFILGKRTAELLPFIARYLFERRDEWDMIVLRNVPVDSPTFSLLPVVMRSLGLGSTDLERVVCPTLVIASRQAEIHRLLDSYSLRRRINGLRRLGEVTFARCSSQAQVELYLPQFVAQYIERRRGSAAAKSFMQPEVPAFLAALARSMLPAGWLHFSVLECAGRPAAFHFGFEFGGRLYWYKPSFDPQLARQSPGNVLLSHLIRDGLERNLAELDFTVGAEEFKFRYASTQRSNANLRVFRRRWLHLSMLALASARRIARRWRRAHRRRTRALPGDGRRV